MSARGSGRLFPSDEAAQWGTSYATPGYERLCSQADSASRIVGSADVCDSGARVEFMEREMMEGSWGIALLKKEPRRRGLLPEVEITAAMCHDFDVEDLDGSQGREVLEVGERRGWVAANICRERIFSVFFRV